MAQISVQTARRAEYPEMGEDPRTITEQDPDTKKNKTKQVRVPVKLTNTFWFTFRNPITGKYERQALTYGQNKTRIQDVDIRNWEAEIGCRPSMVQRELNYRKNPKKGLWEEITGSKVTPECYEDCTDDYNDFWRVDAYRNSEDPYQGQKKPKPVNALEFRAHLLERKVGLLEAKDRNLAVPMFMHDTSTGEQQGMTKAQFAQDLEGERVSNVPEFIAGAGE